MQLQLPESKTLLEKPISQEALLAYADEISTVYTERAELIKLSISLHNGDHSVQNEVRRLQNLLTSNNGVFYLGTICAVDTKVYLDLLAAGLKHVKNEPFLDTLTLEDNHRIYNILDFVALSKIKHLRLVNREVFEHDTTVWEDSTQHTLDKLTLVLSEEKMHSFRIKTICGKNIRLPKTKLLEVEAPNFESYIKTTDWDKVSAQTIFWKGTKDHARRIK